MSIAPEKSREAFEGLVRTGQSLMQGFFDQLSKMPIGVPGAAAANPIAALPPGLTVEAEKMAQLQREHLQRHAKLWATVANRKKDEVVEAVIAPTPGDRRFNAPEWSASPVYDYIRQAYLINAQFLSSVAEAVPVNDKLAKSRLQFLTRQYIDALSPANFAATNPEFVKRALVTG